MEPIHSLCLLEGNQDKGYPALYDKISRYASQNYAIIYAVEADTTQTVRRMSQHGVDVESLVESGALSLVDRNEMYSIDRTDLDGHALLDSWHTVMVKVKRRSNFSGILAMGSAENFFEFPSDQDKLVKYEEMAGKRFHIPLESICCYSQKAFDSLSLGNLLAILNAHYSTVHRNSRYEQWDPQNIVELARHFQSLFQDSETMLQDRRENYRIQPCHARAHACQVTGKGCHGTHTFVHKG